MSLQKLCFSLASLFSDYAMSEKARDAFEADIQDSAARAGFVHTGQTEDGERLFERKSDGATVSMPKKDALRRRDKIRLHGFDGYL